MTEERRKEIFSKEVIFTRELRELFDISESTATNLMQEIKSNGDKLGKNGKILVEDYLRWVDPKNNDRYTVDKEDKTRSVCI